MFDKILIANRGEIACRVISSARKMGISTVAVYSDADRNALHVQLADEAVAIGPPPAAQSYLLGDRIVAACKSVGADAVHPGYGFLSERAGFVEALHEAGITFIGPDTAAITSMGDKITSKRLAEQAGVNTIPGSAEIISSPDHAVTIAARIGFPVMLKASAGGGGKGMRVVWDDDECRDGFERASSEARSSFGDDRVFAEKFIEQPRHIEIQVLGDRHGNIVYLGERECSVQRRHQKVIEECPSPFIDEQTRAAMGEQAVSLARAVDYVSAGTVEFVVDAQRNFYFLEMNTRLQVEHPVTECVTGLDLVEWMIRIADGESLDFSQEQVELNGWAVESRVYAEDPLRNFMPSTGRLVRYEEPQAGPHVRVDSGVRAGGEVSVYYDPMISKLVTFGATRDQAIAHQREALNAYVIRGPLHNISFLNAVMKHPRFLAGDITTNFIAEEYPDGLQPEQLEQGQPELAIAATAGIHWQRSLRTAGPESPTNHDHSNTWVVIRDGVQQRITVAADPHGLTVDIDGHAYRVVSDWRPGELLYEAVINQQPVVFQLDETGIKLRLTRYGRSEDLLVVTPRVAELSRHMIEKQPPDLSRFLISPMPGLLISLTVAEGDEVKAGEELAVVEAMKMENSLRASRDVKIARIMAAQGDSLSVDQPMIEFE